MEIADYTQNHHESACCQLCEQKTGCEVYSPPHGITSTPESLSTKFLWYMILIGTAAAYWNTQLFP